MKGSFWTMQTTEVVTPSQRQTATDETRGVSSTGFWIFVRRHMAAILLISVALLIPCFWLPRIEAGDLASHVYNAWLASLVQEGQAPGLWIAPQTNNILADVLLLRLGVLMGFSVAEKIVVASAVLVFFWGAFALTTSLSDIPAWSFAPVLAMLSYGWTFQMGFLNFYLSLGISFAALAILWKASGRAYLLAALLVPLIWIAHPLELVWFLGVAAYMLLAKRLSPRFRVFAFVAALLFLFAVRLYFVREYRTAGWQGPVYALNGSNQLVLGDRYLVIAPAVLTIAVGWAIWHSLRNYGNGTPISDSFPVPLQLFLIGLLTLPFLPDFIWISQYSEPVGFICSRFSLAVAILGCCALAGSRPGIMFGALTGAIAIFYFGVMYQDATRTYAMEKQAEALVAKLPQDARVVSTLFPFRGSPFFVHHVVDRACVGRCFSIDNYEAYSQQFRIRAVPGNRIVSADVEQANHMMAGDYVVLPSDLPLWQIFQCGPTEIDLCLRPLHPGSLLNFIPSEAVRARHIKPS
jgi:hypothetical protein